ncbi:MAG: heparinase II/III-family protein [Bacteroidales bacterium]|nr:heparinase II/III-family protein [Bacteroidales bacterium]
MMNFILTSILASTLEILIPHLDSAYPRIAEGNAFKDEAKATERVEKWAERPESLRARLQMYWNSHATEVYIEGEQLHHVGGPAAPVPTVRYVANRGGESAWARPSLEDVPEYQDSLGMWMRNRKDGHMAWVDPKVTGGAAGSINNEIMSIARDAAALYHKYGKESHAELAALVFDTFMSGLYYRSVPLDLAHGHQQTLVGPTSFEVIHENVIVPSAECYDFLHDYLLRTRPEKISMYEDCFRKWADAIIEGGVPHNNWNLIQAQFVLRVALVLQSDAAYSDGRGREWYLNEILNENSIRQWSIGKLIDYGFDMKAGVWTECANYATMVMDEFSSFVRLVNSKLGIRLEETYPVLKKAITVIPQYFFPNGMIASWGDSYYTLSNRSYFMKLEGPVTDYQTPVFYSEGVSWFAARSGNDPQSSLMMSVAGAEGNHAHANGLTMELYGKGYVQGVDSGRGAGYTTLDHGEYYAQFPAHNTVCVDGVSSFTFMQSHHPFKLEACYPQPMEKEYLGGVMYGDFSFIEPETLSDQRRQLVMVAAKEGCGYYVDVFRSHKKDGKDKFHDYFYHNIGQSLELSAADGSSLDLQPTQELSFAGASIYAYSYFWDKYSAMTENTVKGKFTMSLPDGGSNGMMLWMKGAPERKVFKALAPKVNAFKGSKMPYPAHEEPCRTFIARQYGEAWNKPFTAVYQPYASTDKMEISGVEFAGNGFEAVKVSFSDGQSHVILSADRDMKMKYDATEADATLAVVCPENILLEGRSLHCTLSDGTRIDIESRLHGCTVLKKMNGEWKSECDAGCNVKINGKKLKP